MKIYDWLIENRRDLWIKEQIQLALGLLMFIVIFTIMLLGGFIWG